MNKLRRLVACERGHTLIELLQVTVILGVVLTGLTVLFVQAQNAQLDMNRRFVAQQDARIAVDRMRREVHCARLVSPTGVSNSITVTLPGGCPTAGSSEVTVVYATQSVGTNRWELRRDGVRVVDFVSLQNVFEYSPQSTTSLAKLRLTLPINTKPAELNKQWKLVADIVLRNSTRT